MQVGGPFTDKEGSEKSSSDGLVKELLIWQHRALILLSPSPGSPMSISGTSKKGTHRWEVRRGGGKRENGNMEDNKKLRWNARRRGLSRGTKKQKERRKNDLFIFATDPVSIKSMKLERMRTLMRFTTDLKSIKNMRFSKAWHFC